MSNINLPPWLTDIKNNKGLMRTISLGFREKSKSQKLFISLLSDKPELQTMWSALKGRDKQNGELWFIEFHHHVEISLTRTLISRHSKASRNKYANKISKNAEKLATLLKESDFDTGIYDAMNEQTVLRLTGLPADESRFLWVSDFLMQVSKMANKQGSRTDIIRTSDTPNADQVYYMRRLTKCMREKFNTPMRGVVATSASIIFDNPLIDVPYVANYAP